MQRHATDVVSLVCGTILAGFGLVWLLTVTDVLNDDQAWLAGPIVLIAAGAVGLLTALRRRPPVSGHRSSPAGDQRGDADEPAEVQRPDATAT